MKYLCFLLIFVSAQLQATEAGDTNYLPGFYGDFRMAVMPEHGTYFNNFFAAYQDHSGKLGTLLEIPGIIHATGHKIFGGNFSFGIYPGVLATKDDTRTSNFDRVGLADVYLLPASLGWSWDKVALLVYEGIIAPTGYYQKGALNSGLNIWTFDHNISVTWELPADNELSVNLGYMNNIKNSATHHKSGDLVHFDYMLGHYFSPVLGLGVVGSYYYQTTADHAPASILEPDRGEGATIGPVVMYTPHFLDRDVSFSLKWQHEFDAKGHAPKDFLILKVWSSF